jgi:DNA-binding transcriptional LysR family regulator
MPTFLVTAGKVLLAAGGYTAVCNQSGESGADFENATSRIGRGQTAPRGVIRVTVPPTFARLHMVSKLPAFFTAYPDMAVEMAASESPTTIIEDGFDLAIHSGDLPDSTLVARRFAQTTIVLVAGRSQPLSIRRLCRAGLRTAVEPWLWT